MHLYNMQSKRFAWIGNFRICQSNKENRIDFPLSTWVKYAANKYTPVKYPVKRQTNKCISQHCNDTLNEMELNGMEWSYKKNFLV